LGGGVVFIECAAAKAKNNIGVLEEAVNLNNRFFRKVKKIVKSTITRKGSSYQQIYQLAKPHYFHDQNLIKEFDNFRRSARSSLDNAHHRIDETNGRIDRENQDLHDRIDEANAWLDRENKELHERIDRLGAEINELRGAK
jgi:hypothetical protein